MVLDLTGHLERCWRSLPSRSHQFAFTPQMFFCDLLFVCTPAMSFLIVCVSFDVQSDVIEPFVGLPGSFPDS